MKMLKLLLVAATLVVLPKVAEAHGRDQHWGHGVRSGHWDHWDHRAPQAHVYFGPRFERGPGHVWIPGYWGYRGPRRVWIAGAWALPPQPGYVWMPPRQVWNGYAWVWQDGYWAPAPY